MNLLRPAWLSAGLALLLSGAGAVAQGTFQNLGFESATVVGPPGTSVNFGQALSEPHTPTIAPPAPTVLPALEQLLGYERFSERSQSSPTSD